MEPIKPTKIVKSTPVSPPDTPNTIDSAEARSAYDPRLYADQSLVDAYKHYPLMRFFGLTDDEKADDKINDKVKSVYDWALNKTKSDDANQIMKTIRYLEMEIGLPQLGTSRLDNINNFVVIENQIKDLENERRFQYGF